jgi:hypothetical protein
MLEKHQLFLDQGSSAVEEMENINDRLSELRTMVGEEFPLDQSQAEDMRNEIASKVKNVWDIESEGIEDLARVLGS